MKVVPLNTPKRLCYAIFIILGGALSVTTRGMWGDEVCRVVDAVNGSVSGVIESALVNAQPGYLLYTFLWVRLFHISNLNEWLLRFSNIVFVPLQIYFAYKIIDKKKWSEEAVFLFFLHPMFVYYMNETTPYIILYTLALVFTYLVFFAENFASKPNLILINIVFLLGVFVHFIFGFIILLYFAKILYDIRKEKGNIKRHAIIMACFGVLYLPLLWIYLKNLESNPMGFSIKNLLYIPYAFLGMSGAGLSRNDLRATEFQNMQIYQIVFLTFFTVFIIGIIIFVILHAKILSKNKRLLFCMTTYFLVFITVSIGVGFGLWERHCFTVFPLFLIIMGDILFAMLKERKWKWIAAGYMICLVLSCVNLRFNYYYSCDDHKGVQQEIAKVLNEGGEVAILATPIAEREGYSLSNLIYGRNQELFILQEKTREGILDSVRQFSDEGKKVVLVLYRKSCRKDVYHWFDTSDEGRVDDQYNSYRIVYYD